MRSHLVKWHEEFGGNLTVIEVDDGKTDSVAQVRDWADKDKIPYPVFYDAEGVLVAAHGVRAFPSTYLLGHDGRVVWEGGGWGGKPGVAEIEQAIRVAI